jgi:Outer membrane protein beta-barrel domain
LNQKIKKFVILLVISGVFALKASAQITEEPPTERFGFQAGVNISNMNFNEGEPTPSVNIPSSWKTGFTFGFQVRIPLVEKLLLQPEYSFSEKSGSDKSLGIDYTIDYFSLPVLLSYQVIPRLNIVAGPQFELLVNAGSTKNGVYTNITHDVEERGFGILGGFEFTIIKSFFLSVRYLQGLNHVGIGQRSDVKEFKYQSVILIAGIRF